MSISTSATSTRPWSADASPASTASAVASASTSRPSWCRFALSREFASRAGWELQNLLTIARLMIRAALERPESRGVHYRSDFRQRDDDHWRRHIIVPPFAQMG